MPPWSRRLRRKRRKLRSLTGLCSKPCWKIPPQPWKVRLFWHSVILHAERYVKFNSLIVACRAGKIHINREEATKLRPVWCGRGLYENIDGVCRNIQVAWSGKAPRDRGELGQAFTKDGITFVICLCLVLLIELRFCPDDADFWELGSDPSEDSQWSLPLQHGRQCNSEKDRF